MLAPLPLAGQMHHSSDGVPPRSRCPSDPSRPGRRYRAHRSPATTPRPSPPDKPRRSPARQGAQRCHRSDEPRDPAEPVPRAAFGAPVELPLDLSADPETVAALEPAWARLVGAVAALARPTSG